MHAPTLRNMIADLAEKGCSECQVSFMDLWRRGENRTPERAFELACSIVLFAERRWDVTKAREECAVVWVLGRRGDWRVG